MSATRDVILNSIKALGMEVLPQGAQLILFGLITPTFLLNLKI